MFVRLATAADLDAITWVLVNASPLDPIYPYRFPDRHLYPAEFTALCRQKCREYLATSTVVVCEMDNVGVVAFSAWDTPVRRFHPVGEPISRPSNNPIMPITIGHKDRMLAFRQECASNKTRLFDSRFRSKGGHMFLKILLCHPDYQRRGAGTALTMWGINEARRQGGLHTTVFASPMGLALYKKLGFKEIGKFRVQLEDDDAFLEIPALVLPGRPSPAGEHQPVAVL
ncbi:acyl-CoA N-acyltransferase [Apodospora peruviana]|uniref:Acyl-CoA N-acyltransferase n=1 Tax=Apodospora peruviana TaxID=516989 RepID=A0AAE0HSD5_9PEZI|nr:acyl-CoA N-acyltransferase [Apodospora peruviana]